MGTLDRRRAAADRADRRALDQPEESDHAAPALPPRRDPDAAQHLENLRVALAHLDSALFAKLIRPTGRPPFLQVRNPAAGHLSEDVTVKSGAADCDPICFVWSWGQAIGAVTDLEGSAAALRRVLASRPQDL
jgi:hypothetical protein